MQRRPTIAPDVLLATVSQSASAAQSGLKWPQDAINRRSNEAAREVRRRVSATALYKGI
jgi:hypothetical protein